MAMATILAYSLPSIFLGEAFRANWSFGKLIVIPAIALTVTSLMAVSYTHLDVYKRQVFDRSRRV